MKTLLLSIALEAMAIAAGAGHAAQTRVQCTLRLEATATCGEDGDQEPNLAHPQQFALGEECVNLTTVLRANNVA